MNQTNWAIEWERQRLFVELHQECGAIQIAVDDIRMVSPLTQNDVRNLSNVQGGDKYKTRILLKGDAYSIYVHEEPHTVLRLCMFVISRV